MSNDRKKERVFKEKPPFFTWKKQTKLTRWIDGKNK